MTAEEHARGYVICECERFAYVWRSELLRWKPDDYHGECCEDCGQWTCSLEVVQDCERKMKRAGKKMLILEASEVSEAKSVIGVIYFESPDELKLLRAWAGVLNHAVRNFLECGALFKPHKWPSVNSPEVIECQDHYAALKQANPELSGVVLMNINSVPEGGIFSDTAKPGTLNHTVWSRCYAQNYLLHPSALARFIDARLGCGGLDAVIRSVTNFFIEEFGEKAGPLIADDFLARPITESKAVRAVLAHRKNRDQIVGRIFCDAGIHELDNLEFDQIAAQMLPEEIHPEVKEKLDFIQQAFGL